MFRASRLVGNRPVFLPLRRRRTRILALAPNPVCDREQCFWGTTKKPRYLANVARPPQGVWTSPVKASHSYTFRYRTTPVVRMAIARNGVADPTVRPCQVPKRFAQLGRSAGVSATADSESENRVDDEMG